MDAIRGAVLISGLVVVMMMLIESMNISSKGDFFGGLRRSKVGQVVISAFLGAIPGCMGGFASVSLYTHGIISFGALVAMLIASSGDEAFVMLATIPGDALKVFLVLLAIAILVGIVVDFVHPGGAPKSICKDEFKVHGEEEESHAHGRHISWQRVVMFNGVILFLVCLLTGMLEHEGHDAAAGEAPAGLLMNLLSEEWMYWLFGVLSLIVLGVLIFGSDHFVEEHFWKHIVRRHLPSVFLWTFGVLTFLGLGLHYLDIESWISSNTAWMIVLDTLVGIIPESGPHLVFVTLYAAGVVPLPVLLASCISQDGHASLPLLAESKKGFLAAKAVNCLVALAVGFGAMLFM